MLDKQGRAWDSSLDTLVSRVCLYDLFPETRECSYSVCSVDGFPLFGVVRDGCKKKLYFTATQWKMESR